jgi:hypothetical protein
MIFTSPLRGISFLPIDDKLLVASLKVGDQLRLERIKDNQYDPNAIAVWYGGSRIGWIARDVARDLARHMDDDHHFTCRVDSFDGKVPQLFIVEITEDQAHASEEGLKQESDQPEHSD